MRHRNGPVDDHRMCSGCSRIDPYARDNTLLSLWRMPYEGLRCVRESGVARGHCLDHCLDHCLNHYGVYQIDDVQARSWCVIGTSGGILMANRNAS